SSQYHMRVGWAKADALEDLFHRHVVLTERNIDLIQQHQLECRVGEITAGNTPASLRHLLVADAVLCFPSESATRGVKDDLISPRLESALFRRLPCALDELNNRNTVAVAEASQDHS